MGEGRVGGDVFVSTTYMGEKSLPMFVLLINVSG